MKQSERVLTPEPYGSSVAILVNNSIFIPGRAHDVINHPDGGENEEEDEENLHVGDADVHVVVSAAADQSAAQDQDVDTNDPGQHPSPVSDALPHHLAGGDVHVGLTGVLRLTRCADVVGQVGLLRLHVFDRHPARLTGIAIGQTLAWIAAVQTHGSSSL